MLKPKPSINLNIFTIIDLGRAVYKEKKKQQQQKKATVMS